MGHPNIQFTRETSQGPAQQRPDTSIFDSSVPNFPQPNLQSAVPAPGSQCNFNVHPIAEYHDNAVFYSMPPYNGIVQPQYRVANLDVAVGAPSSHYNPYLAPLSGRRDFPVQFSQSANHGVVGIPTDSIACVDGVSGSFKSKNSEGIPNYQHQSASAGPSSSVTHITSAPPVQLPGNPWLHSNFGANNGHTAWPHARIFPYGYASANGVCVEAGVQGYPVRSINRGPAGFMPPPYAQGHPNHHSPAQLWQAVAFNHSLQVATSSRGTPAYSLSNTGINPTPDVRPTFLAPVPPPTSFRLRLPDRGETVIDPNTRHRSLPHLRILPEDVTFFLYKSSGHK